MTNHIYIVAEPEGDPMVLSTMMKRVNGHHSAYINRLEGRSAGLWEGRYKASPIQADNWVLLRFCEWILGRKIKHRVFVRQRWLPNLEIEILSISNASGPLSDHTYTDVASLDPGTVEFVLRVIGNAYMILEKSVEPALKSIKVTK